MNEEGFKKVDGKYKINSMVPSLPDLYVGDVETFSKIYKTAKSMQGMMGGLFGAKK